MIEQIINYFTIETIYFWLNLGVLPFWLILIFFPHSHICKIFTTSVFPIIMFSSIYCYLFYLILLDDYNFINNFNLYKSFDELINLVNQQNFLILFWVHFLAINLFCGSWIIKDNQKYNVSKIIIFFPLIVTYLIGPLGIFIYWIIKIFSAKKITLYD